MTQRDEHIEQEQVQTDSRVIRFPAQPSTAPNSGNLTDTNPSRFSVESSIIERYMQQLPEVIQVLVQANMNAEMRSTTNTDDDEDDWSLSVDQMFFMLRYNNAIESAFEADDMESLRELAASDEYLSIFGDMGFDEAYDRYETMLEEGRA